MNKKDTWIEVKNTKECAIASVNIAKTLNPVDQAAIKNIVQGKKQVRQETFFVIDCEISRKVFSGFYTETDATF